MKNLLIFALLFVMGIFNVCAQNCDWVKQIGSTQTEAVKKSVADQNGNIYLLSYSNSSSLIFGGTVFNNPTGNYAYYLSKIDSSGSYAWTQRILSRTSVLGDNIDLQITQNFLYMSGYFDTLNVGIFNLVSSGSRDVFLTKIDFNGNFIWAKQGGSSLADASTNMIIDINENIYICGNTSGVSVTFGSLNLSISAGGFFVVKYDSSGNALVLKKPFSAIPSTVAIDNSGNLYYSFTSSNSLFSLGNSGGTDVYIAKFNSNISLVWAKKIDGNLDDAVHKMIVDNSGNVYVAGLFKSDFIQSGAVILSNASSGTDDVFLIKYDSSGNSLWGSYASGSGSEDIPLLTKDNNGNVYLSGAFKSSVLTCGWNSNNVFNNNSNTKDLYVFKIKPSGVVAWYSSMSGGTNFSSNLDETVSQMKVDFNGNVYLSGAFKSYQILFGGDTLRNSTTAYSNAMLIKYDSIGNKIWGRYSGGSDDDFVNEIILDQLKGIYLIGGFKSPSISFGYTVLNQLNNNGDVFAVKYDTSGRVYQLTKPSASITTMSSTIFCQNDSVVLTTISGASYQWFLNGNLINGATTNSLTVNSQGSYSVLVSKNGCDSLSVPVSVIVNPLPTIPVITQIHDTLFVQGNGNYQWFLNGVLLSGATTSFYVPSISGVYTVKTTDINSCSSVSNPFSYILTELSELKNQVFFIVNPVTDYLIIHSAQNISLVYEMFSVDGKRLKSGSFETTSEKSLVNVSDLNAGLYVLKLNEQTKKIFIVK